MHSLKSCESNDFNEKKSVKRFTKIKRSLVYNFVLITILKEQQCFIMEIGNITVQPKKYCVVNLETITYNRLPIGG